MSKNALNSTSSAGDLEALVMPHLDLACAVALKLTRDAERTERLIRETLQELLSDSSVLADGRSLKTILLSRLRANFISRYADPQPVSVRVGGRKGCRKAARELPSPA